MRRELLGTAEPSSGIHTAGAAQRGQEQIAELCGATCWAQCQCTLYGAARVCPPRGVAQDEWLLVGISGPHNMPWYDLVA